MAMSALAQGRDRTRQLLRGDGMSLAVFAATMLLSAFLLFSVQPLFAKLVLPKLGGSPSVWAVSMCFFQTALLGGYCYAHLLNRWLPTKYAIGVHFIALTLAWNALPIGLPQAITEPPAGAAYFWLIAILAAGAGLPFLVISASAPLLQTWFARSGNRHGADPYFLYGASNFGSLTALLAYPIVIEPFLGLSVQTVTWSGGFCLLALLFAACGAFTGINSSNMSAQTAAGSSARATATAPLTWPDRVLWIALSFVPSGLLVAFTTFLTTDVASAPFLWVMPLALFLATFILVFRDRPALPQAAMLEWQPRLFAFTALGLGWLGGMGWYLSLVAGVLAFFVTSMACHRRLYETRPAAEHLTEFYLWMSLGGVLGGMFAALLAPQIFNTVIEFPLLMALGLLLRPKLWSGVAFETSWRNLGILIVAGLTVVVAVDAAVQQGWLPSDMRIKTGIVGLLVVGMLLQSSRPVTQVAIAGLVVAALAILPFGRSVGQTERSFFGVHRVVDTADGAHRLLLHGITMHGVERLKDASGRAMTAAPPASYYHAAGTMARGVEIARGLLGTPARPLAAAVVGLGTGAMACHAKAGERWDFFEIDPVVVAIARDPERFTFMSRCQPGARVIMGDARLTLAREPVAAYDYLLIDAFSSDAIPVHMLTREAVAMYLDRVTPSGVLALHVSNRHLDLKTVVARLLSGLPIAGAVYVLDQPTGSEFDVSSSHVVLLAKSPAALAAIRAVPEAEPLAPMPGQPWTDDYSNILSALWSRYWK
jgi:hypothetical protein